MTTVKTRCGKGRYEIIARGHATGSVAGCGYISGILYSLAGYLVNEGDIQVERHRMEPGDVTLRFRGGERARAAYDMTLIGLKQLERSHPELIRVTEEAFPYESEGERI